MTRQVLLGKNENLQDLMMTAYEDSTRLIRQDLDADFSSKYQEIFFEFQDFFGGRCSTR